MAAIEYSIEHDDGQSLRALDRADVILIAPSRCGKTPTTMYLALQHGLFVANYPLVEEDLESSDLPVRSARSRTGASGAGDAGTPMRGAPAAPAELPVRLARAVHLRAAAGRGDVRREPRTCDQLHHPLGGGDVYAHCPDLLGAAARRSPRERSQRMSDHSQSAEVRWFSQIGMADLEDVGGKNASLGEMISNLASAGMRVPDGFATTAQAYRDFIGQQVSRSASPA